MAPGTEIDAAGVTAGLTRGQPLIHLRVLVLKATVLCQHMAVLLFKRYVWGEVRRRLSVPSAIHRPDVAFCGMKAQKAPCLVVRKEAALSVITGRRCLDVAPPLNRRGQSSFVLQFGAKTNLQSDPRNSSLLVVAGGLYLGGGHSCGAFGRGCELHLRQPRPDAVHKGGLALRLVTGRRHLRDAPPLLAAGEWEEARAASAGSPRPPPPRVLHCQSLLGLLLSSHICGYRQCSGGAGKGMARSSRGPASQHTPLHFPPLHRAGHSTI